MSLQRCYYCHADYEDADKDGGWYIDSKDRSKVFVCFWCEADAEEDDLDEA